MNIPEWLDPNNEDNFSELEDQYNRVPGRYASIVNPLNRQADSTIAYQTSAGNQAANSAAAEYAARTMQQGGSAAGAGVVRAQALLPIFAANQSVRSQTADKTAALKSESIKTQVNIAAQMAELRDSYSKTLANYITTRQGQALQSSQFDRSLAAQTANQSSQSRLEALRLSLATPGPSGSWQQNNLGEVTSGLDTYNAQEAWKTNRSNALSKLAGLI